MRNFFLFFLLAIILGFIGFFSYFIFNEVSNKKIEESTSEIKEQIHEPVATPLTSIEFNQEIMENLLQNVDLTQFRSAIILNPEIISSQAPKTDYAIEDFQIDPRIFQKLFLKFLSQKLNFLNLKLKFNYYENYHRVEIEIIDQENSENVVHKNFKIASIMND